MSLLCISGTELANLLVCAGLPDGTYIFRPKFAIWVILEGLAMEDVRIFFGHLVYFTAI
jgi:hypothetical protein